MAEEDVGHDAYVVDYLAKHENPNRLMIIERSKNHNIVAYEALLDGDGALDASRAGGPVEAYWLAIDPAFVAERRAKGIEGDRNELGTLERTFAYGVSCKPVEGATGEFSMHLVAFSKKEIRVRLDASGRPRALATVNGVACYLVWVYVKSVERMFGLPRVEYVMVYGEAVDGSGEQRERIEP
mmetsp:Transcript_20295/g.71774  ORF Transcript_20295/g.71774 Transcript_20295/m.71774 type:complete len:183 (-) Transcript_20295:139-687(-)